MSSFEFAIAEVQNDLKVTRLAQVKPKKSLLTMTQTKGNRCRTNRTSGTNFVKQVWMIKSLSKQRSSKQHLIIHMKFLLLVVIGVLLWNNNDARMFTADALQSASDFVEPSNTKPQTIGERIDSFLDWITFTN